MRNGLAVVPSYSPSKDRVDLKMPKHGFMFFLRQDAVLWSTGLGRAPDVRKELVEFAIRKWSTVPVPVKSFVVLPASLQIH